MKFAYAGETSQRAAIRAMEHMVGTLASNIFTRLLRKADPSSTTEQDLVWSQKEMIAAAACLTKVFGRVVTPRQMRISLGEPAAAILCGTNYRLKKGGLNDGE